MRSLINLLAALFLPACATLALQTDDFHDRIVVGCPTETACADLEAQAQARRQTCQPNTIGSIRCSDAEADLMLVHQKLLVFQHARLAKEEAARQAQFEQRAEEQRREHEARKAAEKAEYEARVAE